MKTVSAMIMHIETIFLFTWILAHVLFVDKPQNSVLIYEVRTWLDIYFS